VFNTAFDVMNDNDNAACRWPVQNESLSAAEPGRVLRDRFASARPRLCHPQ